MTDSTKKLRTIMDYFAISGNQLAKAINADPSLVSRWLSGKRKLRAASEQMDVLAEYILAQSRSIDKESFCRKHPIKKKQREFSNPVVFFSYKLPTRLAKTPV